MNYIEEISRKEMHLAEEIYYTEEIVLTPREEAEYKRWLRTISGGFLARAVEQHNTWLRARAVAENKEQ